MESFTDLVARVNRGGFILPPDPTGASTVAKQIKLKKGQDFHFPTKGSAGPQSKYPWDEWLNGDLLLLEQSIGTKDDKGTVTDPPTEKRDFEVSPDAMVGKLKSAARRRYKVVQISRYDADGTRLVDSLIIRARGMDGAERAAEDLRRAEEREARKERADDAAPAPAPATADQPQS